MTSSIIIFIIKRRSVHCYSSQSQKWEEKRKFFLTREFSRTLFSKTVAHISVLLRERANLCCRACGFNLTEEDLKAAAALPSAPGNFGPILFNIKLKIYYYNKKDTLSFSSLYGTRTTNNQENIFLNKISLWHLLPLQTKKNSYVLHQSY